jgi:hypothetical protein
VTVEEDRIIVESFRIGMAASGGTVPTTFCMIASAVFAVLASAALAQPLRQHPPPTQQQGAGGAFIGGLRYGEGEECWRSQSVLAGSHGRL